MKKKIISFLVVLIATIVVLYFSLKDDYTTIVNTVFSINKYWFLFSFVVLFGYYFFRSLVIYKITSDFNKNYKFKDALRLVLETNFFHAVTPFATGGQPYEIYSLNKHKIKISDAMSISVSNFIVYQIALVFLGLISIICNYFLHIIDASILKKLVTLGFIINFSVIVVLLLISFSKKTDKTIVDFFIDVLSKLKIIRNEEKMKEKFHDYLKEFNMGSKLLLKNKKQFINLILMHLISLICLYLVPLCLFLGIGININSYTCVIIMSYVMLIGSFVPIPGGTGGLEYGFVTFFSKVLPGSKLNAIMLVWRFITYYFGMILGAIILNIKKEQSK